MQVTFGGGDYQIQVWTDQIMSAPFIAIDTETEMIQHHEIPRLVLAAVYSPQDGCCLIHPDRLSYFIWQHRDRHFIGHNVAFDWAVIHRHLSHVPRGRRLVDSWVRVLSDLRIHDTMLLDELVELARDDSPPIRKSLAKLAQRWAGIREINKSDPFRLRYGEILGIPESQWAQVDSGFFSYAAKDPIATWFVWERLSAMAHQLSHPFAARTLPDVVCRYGVLTEAMQAAAAVICEAMGRRGIRIERTRVDTARAAALEAVSNAAADLDRLQPDSNDDELLFGGGQKELFKRYKRTGALKITRSQVPQLRLDNIGEVLESIATVAEIVPPRTSKTNKVSTSPKWWAQHRSSEPFIDAFCRLAEQSKLVSLLCPDTDRIHPRYNVLVRTGRASCSNPNLQQVPRREEFRTCFVADPGCVFLVMDYSQVELRTLAAVCQHRYGQSRLADLFQANVDPHKFTAALILDADTAAQLVVNQTPDQIVAEFDLLPADIRKPARQKAKAINFGVPGALGAKSLSEYARGTYGVNMTVEEAEQFRTLLIAVVYPELSRYLAIDSYQAVATNLNTSPERIRHLFPTEFQLGAARRILKGLNRSNGDKYSLKVINHVWSGLQSLCQDQHLRERLVRREPSPEIAADVFHGSVSTLTGRVRGRVRFSQQANTPFQGLAADAAKLAMVRIVAAGYDLAAFIHDEVLIQVPIGTDYKAVALEIKQILCDSLTELTPGVPADVDYHYADCWLKDVPDGWDRHRPYFYLPPRTSFDVGDVVRIRHRGQLRAGRIDSFDTDDDGCKLRSADDKLVYVNVPGHEALVAVIREDLA